MGKHVADMTPEELERQREYMREWQRQRRANMTPEQRERDREQRRKLQRLWNWKIQTGLEQWISDVATQL
jgi:hypothetical protein